MGRTEQYRKLGFGVKFPDEAIDMADGSRIKMVSDPGENEGLLLANRRYNDARYLRNPDSSSVMLVNQGIKSCGLLYWIA